jgi:hypothetical protein
LRSNWKLPGLKKSVITRSWKLLTQVSSSCPSRNFQLAQQLEASGFKKISHHRKLEIVNASFQFLPLQELPACAATGSFRVEKIYQVITGKLEIVNASFQFLPLQELPACTATGSFRV